MIEVKFSEEIEFSGDLHIELEVGIDSVGVGKYISGYGTSLFLFEYIVEREHESLDLEYAEINSLVSSDGIVTDLSGNPADLFLPVKGSSNSLSGNKDIRIDGVQPKVNFVTSSMSDGHYGVDDSLDDTYRW